MINFLITHLTKRREIRFKNVRCESKDRCWESKTKCAFKRVVLLDATLLFHEKNETMKRKITRSCCRNCRNSIPCTLTHNLGH